MGHVSGVENFIEHVFIKCFVQKNAEKKHLVDKLVI